MWRLLNSRITFFVIVYGVGIGLAFILAWNLGLKKTLTGG